jgi:hypothetical protein
MAVKSKAQILTDLAAAINDNTAGEITPADVRGIFTDIVDSLSGETFDASFDGQGNVITSGVDVWRPVLVGGPISKAALVADVAGSVTVTVRKYTPAGGALGSATLLGTLTLTSAQHAASTPSWAVAAGDVLEIEPSAVTAITKLFVRLST